MYKISQILPLSSKPWVISCPMTTPIPPQLSDFGKCWLQNKGCKMPAGNTGNGKNKSLVIGKI